MLLSNGYHLKSVTLLAPKQAALLVFSPQSHLRTLSRGLLRGLLCGISQLFKEMRKVDEFLTNLSLQLFVRQRRQITPAAPSQVLLHKTIPISATNREVAFFILPKRLA